MTDEKTMKDNVKRQVEWNKRNRDKLKKYQRQYQLNHREKIKGYNREYNKKKYYNNEHHRNKQILYSRHNQFLHGKNDNFASFIDMDRDVYVKKLESRLPEGMTIDDYGDKWLIKRKRPAKEFNFADYNEAKCFFSLDNVDIKLLV